jgi:hypothetical protein
MKRLPQPALIVIAAIIGLAAFPARAQGDERLTLVQTIDMPRARAYSSRRMRLSTSPFPHGGPPPRKYAPTRRTDRWTLR